MIRTARKKTQIKILSIQKIKLLAIPLRLRDNKTWDPGFIYRQKSLGFCEN
jgi:hypothetical protein